MAISLVDSHCHLNFEPLHDRLPQVLSDARAAGVDHFLCVSVSMEKAGEVVDIARRFPQVFASVGVHPDEQAGREPTAQDLVRLADDERVVAIGETGLDYFRIKGDMTWQRDRFRNHIHAALETRKPLIIHTRNAREDTIQMMKGENARDIGGVMHCFTEDWPTAKAALDLGFYISFSGILTFRNAEDLRNVARQVPADRLLVETDAPYLAPVPMRGRPNEPAFVSHTARALAELRETSYEDLSAVTTHNFFELFGSARPAQAV